MQALYLVQCLSGVALSGESHLRFTGDPSSVSRVRPDSDSGIEESRKAEVGADIRQTTQAKELVKSALALTSCQALSEPAQAGESKGVTADLT